ncbi:MAG: hypothetical protein NT069_35320 [Planctomycetota bacterium]|nr:hypothetical protein [Planctomycetota bacterium]
MTASLARRPTADTTWWDIESGTGRRFAGSTGVLDMFWSKPYTLADWRMLRGHLLAQEMAGEPMDSPATRRVLGLDSARGEHVLM